MARLTTCERKAYDALVAAGHDMDVDQISKAVYGDKPRSRTRICAIMRMLVLKTERENVRAYRVSPLGRGSVGVYGIKRN